MLDLGTEHLLIISDPGGSFHECHVGLGKWMCSEHSGMSLGCFSVG